MFVLGTVFTRRRCIFPYFCGETYCECDPAVIAEILAEEPEWLEEFGINSGKNEDVGGNSGKS